MRTDRETCKKKVKYETKIWKEKMIYSKNRKEMKRRNIKEGKKEETHEGRRNKCYNIEKIVMNEFLKK